MRDLNMSASRAGWLRGHPKYAPTASLSLRTAYKPQARTYEEIPLAQFQQLPRQGKLEEHETQSPYGGHEQRVYRLV
jgi:hypothetical protein